MLEISKKRLFFWVAATVLLCFMLGSADLWTQEWRWADIVWRMRAAGDYFHPNLAGQPYYDKPLLSYWLMLLTTHLLGLNEWGLRLPSALAGLLTLACTIQIGKILFNKPVAYLAGWILLTSYFFVFWSRVASADMLNVAGIMVALAWYFSRKATLGAQRADSMLGYSIFFLILAAASLIKGPVAVAVTAIVVLADLTATRTLKVHLNFRLLISILPALAVYFLPFVLAHQGEQSENSLYLVYKENILRFLVPFDHQDPWYSYFIYLPFYLLPWTFLLIPLALRQGKTLFRLKGRAAQQTGFLLAIVAVFIFFTLSGSRRSYYVLPLLPLVVLWLAEQLTHSHLKNHCRYYVVSFYVVLLLWFGCLQPLHAHFCGIKPDVAAIKARAMQLKPWSQWRVVMLEADDRIGFYLQPTQPPRSYRFYADAKDLTAQLQGPVMVVTNKKYLAALQAVMPQARIVEKLNDKDIALMRP